MEKVVLPKIWAWTILSALVILDGFLDIIFAQSRGLESIIWKPISNALGITNPILLTPIVLLIFFAFTKILAPIVKKTDKVPKAEELILTTLVIVYTIFDLWLISVYILGFKLFKSHLYLIPLLIIVGIIYEWLAEKKLRSLNKK